MAVKKDEKREQILSLYAQGISAVDIASKLGLPYQQTYYYIRNPDKGSKERKQKAEKKPECRGWNADRHACRSCQYRAGAQDRNKGMKCMYILVEHHSRGCKAECCDKYVKGRRLSIK